MRIVLRYKLPHWTIWNEVVVYSDEEARNWLASLRSEGYITQRY